MTANEYARGLAARLLRAAADEFGNHGCNDMDVALLGDVDFEVKAELEQRFNQWNGSANDPIEFDGIGDYAWMDFCADFIEGKA